MRLILTKLKGINMNLKLISSLLAISLFSVSPGFAQIMDDMNGMNGDNNNRTMQVQRNMQGNRAMHQKDAETIAWLIVLNKNEITAANAVTKRKVDPMVRDYARWMIREHNKNLRETERLSNRLNIKAMNTNAVMALKEKGKQQMASMKPLKGEEFEVAYIDAMVTDHGDALQKINNEILENIHNPKLRQHVMVTRTHIQHHLEKAKEIQNKLES